MGKRPVNYSELARFLIDKRDSTRREMVGMARRAHRSTPGLLPQEVCSLAGVSLTFYERLERGRPLNLTRSLLSRIAGAFRLEPEETNTLYLLADFSSSMDASVNWELQAALDQFKAVPAYICTPRLDVIAFNRPADVIFDFHGDGTANARNQLWRIYTERLRRKIFKQPNVQKSALLEKLHKNLAAEPEKAPYFKLLEDLRRASLTFDRDFREHSAKSAASGKNLLELATAAGPVSANAIELAVRPASRDTLYALMPADEGSASTLRAVCAMPYLEKRAPEIKAATRASALTG